MSLPSSTSPVFDRAYRTLNAAQKKAVDTIEGPVVVIAGPGTGKTTLLTLRIANILRLTDTAPDSILALTFTESGAFAMRRKLLETIGPAAYRVAIHTFHGFASQVIEHHQDYFPRIIGSKLITEPEQIRIIQKIIESRDIEMLRPFGDPEYYVSPVLREIHILKRENITPAELAQSIEAEASQEVKRSATEQEKYEKRTLKNKELALVYARYEKALAKEKYYDFDDMLLEVIRIMESQPEFKLILQEQYQYILADEHQDANAAQNRILELLSDFHDSPNLFIVGDDKQAIYRFQGASLENFLYFSHKYPDAVVIDLEHNYRSHQVILDASHSVITNNPGMPGRTHAKLISLQVGGGPVHVSEYMTADDERIGVMHAIKKLIDGGEKHSEIAILYRDNKHSGPLSDMLRSEGIPHRVESETDIMHEVDVVKIVTLCKAIFDPSDDAVLAQALLLPELAVDPAHVMEISERAYRDKKPLHQCIKSSSRTTYADIHRAYDKIVRWSRDANTLSFTVFLQKIIQETGFYTSIVEAPDSLDRMHALNAFYEYITDASRSMKTFRLKEFIAYITVIEEHGLSRRKTHGEHTVGVRLMTAHRAKGQEFNHVFIVHAVDGVWGSRSSRNLFHIPVIEHARATGRIDDERRLFYVALTRARETVTISWAQGDGSEGAVASRFITEIDPRCMVIEKKDKGVAHATLHRVLGSTLHPYADKNTLLNPEFVRSKFLAQPLSVTHLNNYIECPWRYFFVNLIRIPQAESKHQLYGTAIHAVLRTFFASYAQGEDMVLKRMIEIFRGQIDMLPFMADDREDSFKKGKKALEGYYKTYYPHWNRAVLLEYAVRGTEVSVDKDTVVTLSGKLDKIEINTDDSVTVVDYKTGKPKSRNHIQGNVSSDAGGEGNYFRQLAFYKLLLDGDTKFRMKYGEIDFVEPNDRGIYKKERFEITDTDIEKVTGEIVSMSRALLSLSFVGTTCDNKKCEYCMLGKIISRVNTARNSTEWKHL
ncbi:MAG: ATP-dependent DNA helicase [Patescibacteria group bacterium]